MWPWLLCWGARELVQPQPRCSRLAAPWPLGIRVSSPYNAPFPPGEAMDQQKALLKYCVVQKQQQDRIHAQGCVPGRCMVL